MSFKFNMSLQNFLTVINYPSILCSLNKHPKLLTIHETNKLPNVDWGMPWEAN